MFFYIAFALLFYLFFTILSLILCFICRVKLKKFIETYYVPEYLRQNFYMYKQYSSKSIYTLSLFPILNILSTARHYDDIKFSNNYSNDVLEGKYYHYINFIEENSKPIYNSKVLKELQNYLANDYKEQYYVIVIEAFAILAKFIDKYENVWKDRDYYRSPKEKEIIRNEMNDSIKNFMDLYFKLKPKLNTNPDVKIEFDKYNNLLKKISSDIDNEYAIFFGDKT